MFYMMDFMLDAPLGPYGDARDYDIQKLKTVLNHLGYYRPIDPARGLDAEARDPAMFAAVNAFQRDRGIEPYNHLFPRDETVLALDREVRAIPKNRRYIWRAVGDKKTRSEHAARDGQIFIWNEPPEGGHPGEDYNCRCWAIPVAGFEETVPLKGAFGAPKGLRDTYGDLFNPVHLDAINPTISPFEFVAGGIAIVQGGSVLIGSSIRFISGRAMLQNLKVYKGSAAAVLTSKLRSTNWIDKTPFKQLQKKFKHAKDLGVKGNFNKKTFEEFKSKLKEHVKSKDTIIIRGSYNKKEKMIHYYNPKTRINIMRDQKGNFRSVWKLRPKQRFHLLKDKNVGGN